MTTTLFSTFKALHAQSAPLLLPNAWDAASAKLLQMDGAKAIATSSAAVAWSLGYADGGALPRDELLAAVRRIARVVSVPLTIDLEDGYSNDPQEVAQLIKTLSDCGVVGINLEDGAGSAQLLAGKIAAIRQALGTQPLFINARTDVYLKGLAQGAAAIALCIERLKSYQAAGADGAFVPGMATVADVTQLTAAVHMPLNLMTTPALAPIHALFAAGAKRFSAGPTLFQTSYSYGRTQAQRFMVDADFGGLLAHALPFPVMNAAFKIA
jgi:2-methylisocitrate lyase-like PEP mutase family enzyme